jgi:hypothetical protein
MYDELHFNLIRIFLRADKTIKIGILASSQYRSEVVSCTGTCSQEERLKSTDPCSPSSVPNRTAAALLSLHLAQAHGGQSKWH